MSEKQKPAFDAFSVEERDGQKPFYRGIGAAWETKAKNGFVLDMKCIPLNGRVLLLPHKPPKDETEPQA